MSQEPLRRQTGPIALGPGAGRHPSRQLAPRAPTRAWPAPVNTLAEAVVHWGRTRPSQPLLYFVDLEERLTVLTAGDVLHNTLRLGANLYARGVRHGDRVVLSFDTSPEFLECFLACGLVGATPCLIELPSSKVSVQAWGERLRAKLRLLGARAMLIDPDFVDMAHEALTEYTPEPGQAAPFVAVPTDLVADAEPLTPPTLDADETAFIQFTSGTTDAPKGVQISHRALLANCAAIGEGGGWDSDDLMVCWLPLFHDMGLVASVLASLVHGLPTALMPPFGFLLKPSRWLWAMHAFRATSCFAPNFAYQLCVKRIKDAELDGLELSAWKRAYNAAEFIHADTVHQFTERFGPHGFEPEAWRPSYGMAEMVVGVTCRVRGEPLRVETLSRTALATRREAVPVAPGTRTDALVVHGVGRPLKGIELRIVDEEGHPVPERHEGEILLRGTSLFSGYYQNPEATDAVLRDGWLYTGDLGYLVGSELFICGRSKDLIIKAGENHHPYTMENAAGRVAGVRVGCVAAVGVNNAQTGTEDIVIVCETTESKPDALRQLCKHVEETVFQGAGVRPNRVVPVPPQSLPKTTSGKLKRAYIRQNIEEFEALSLLVKPPPPLAVVH
ncbi:Long-chain-fatty-acid--CoA ligase [Cystobacter fuscus DSM 2262]|uniref:Long-chain-fatty-acid--CoA ligase n=1 Tax=Cystobacter fuscus (strain ATCC 25194 / DSM 2262 / NBRC 100088 / M29) TaxID=1242864 RepID=S9PE56_CYSF2|nr:fatty acyl-AMP ligase [Cystobacter fuscus]EPX61356.1 Long-chain-fatty-acid--CoA ligase [Cystobacter fuscus DSM 2262]